MPEDRADHLHLAVEGDRNFAAERQQSPHVFQALLGIQRFQAQALPGLELQPQAQIGGGDLDRIQNIARKRDGGRLIETAQAKRESDKSHQGRRREARHQTPEGAAAS